MTDANYRIIGHQPKAPSWNCFPVIHTRKIQEYM